MPAPERIFFMSKLIKGNQRHMSLDDRIYIEQALEKSMTFKDISIFVRKDPTTISKEVKKRRVLKIRSSFNTPNNCSLMKQCSVTNLCGKTYECLRKCSKCSLCNTKCTNFLPIVCPTLIKPPFVCNGCEKKGHCRLDKYYYRATSAHSTYRTILSSSREGINLSEVALSNLDNLVSPLILKGQPIAHIFATHAAEIPCGHRTLYNYIENRVLSVKNIDLPRKVKYKPRKQHHRIIKDHSWREGRKYSDFTSFLEENPETSVVEMDVVEGVKGGKVLLTMLFRNSRCMIAFLLNSKTQEAVLSVFRQLEESMTTLVFLKTFPVILTDNGSEFINPILLETGLSSFIRTSVYYCDPLASYQKGSLEKNHEFIRYVIPKGSSLDKLTQEDILKLTNNINSTARASLNNRTPFELASLLLDKSVIKIFNLQKIHPDDVILKPILLKR